MRRETQERIKRLEDRLGELELVIGASRQAVFGGGEGVDKLRRFVVYVNNQGSIESVRSAQPQTGLMERVEKLESR